MLAGTHKIGRLGMTLVGLLLALSFVAPAARADVYNPADWAPSIWSDKADYMPGELVTLSGTNWQAGETVNIVVNDDAGQTWRRDVNVTADSAGTILDSFTLPSWFVAQYGVTATGSSGAVATTTFTDADARYAVPNGAGGVIALDTPASTEKIAKSVTAGGNTTFSIVSFKDGSGTLRVKGAAVSNETNGRCGAGGSQLPASGISVTLDSSTISDNNADGYNLPGSETRPNFTFKVAVAAGTPAGSYKGNIRFGAANGNQSPTVGNGFSLCLTVAPSDTTAPVIVPTVTGTLGGNGWYTSNVSLTWSVTDPESTVSSTSGCGPTNITADQGPITYTCTATSAGSTASQSVSIKRDATAPSVAVALDRTPDSNGWYNHAVGYEVSASSDALSGIDTCQPAATYSGPDSETASVSRSCTDKAGNPGSGSQSFKFDDTNPSVTVALDRVADHNGWYNAAVGYSITAKTDNLSGVDVASCDGPGTYSGPDGDPVSVSRSCADQAGNVGSGSQSFKFDDTNPSVTVALDRVADHNGWYNAAVGYSITAKSDNLSGVDLASCDGPGTYSGPDGDPVSVSRSCADVAGNTGTGTKQFKYDDTAPTSVSGAPDRAADHNGWYNHAVTIQFTGNDATSGIDVCSHPQYDGPDGTALTVNGHCTDVAGNDSADVPSSAFKFDKTNPANVSGAPDRAADHNGWYNHAVGIQFAGDDATSGIDTCSHPSYTGPDGTGITVSGSCTDVAGNTSASVASSSFKFDKTNPTLNTSVSPNPVVLNGSATATAGAGDATSGVESSSCGSADTSSVGARTVACEATDNAGNTASASAGYSVIYAVGGSCLGSPSHQILPPINANWSVDLSVFKQGSTVPAKFRVCDANGVSIGTPGLVTKFANTQKLSLAWNEVIDEAVYSTTPDTAFRWSASDQQWIFNIATKPLKANTTYVYTVTLNDLSTIEFRFGLK